MTEQKKEIIRKAMIWRWRLILMMSSLARTAIAGRNARTRQSLTALSGGGAASKRRQTKSKNRLKSVLLLRTLGVGVRSGAGEAELVLA